MKYSLFRIILTTVITKQQILLKLPYITSHKIPFGGSKLVSYGQKREQTDMVEQTVKFLQLMLANEPKTAHYVVAAYFLA